MIPGAAPAPLRFLARSGREALRLAREALGPEAVIVSNRITADGVEILAAPPLVPAPAAAAAIAAAPLPLSLPSQPLAAAPSTPDAVLRELLSMRSMIEEQLAGRAWSEEQRRDPLRGHLLRLMLGAGFSARLARATVDALPAGLTHADGLAWLRNELAGRLPAIAGDDALLDAGGVFALVGPTGVGKTTTTAKLAARCVLRFGAGKLALVTTDSYRIGAYEQLRIYGRILGVPVHAVKDAGDLRLVLEDLRDKHMVLIDTVGMSQRDRAVSDQVAMLCDAQRPVRRLLLLNATSHGDTLDEVVHAYRRGGREGADDLAGCILTKVDEATHPGAVIDTVIRHGLPLHYVSSGQKVPEHLSLPDPQRLVEAAFQARSRTALFVPGEIVAQEQLASLRTEADVALAQSVASRLRAQCHQLVRALASDARELAGHASALADGGIGFEHARALWRGVEGGATAPPDPQPAAPDPAAAGAQCDSHLLATCGSVERLDEDGRRQRQEVALLLSDRTGLPLAATLRAALAAPDPGRPVVLLLGAPPAAAAGEGTPALAWLARAPARLRVRTEADRSATLAGVAAGLAFGPAQAVAHRGRPALQSLAEARVALAAGQPLQRLVVVRTLDTRGQLLAQRYLLASGALAVDAARLVQWQAWRAAVQPCFRLMKEAHQQLAASGPPEADRAQPMLVAQASTTVWRLAQAREGWAQPARALLAQLAGRRLRPGRAIPPAVLFEGLGKFCVLLDALAQDEAPAPAGRLAAGCA
ncbi:flagellar biosynthesis protein FlhF [Ramlibacter tataouinensis]|uniref:flagellar biosynthesis protein FlhF n=1 Tax=Ramlibacter tataouinensis TaxID=94132 RepID=UPI0022F38474|nr:flagellar biosynthesis protein FlhF [Ramlibacter tataouinensis]WBY00584.1 flagellar biosynthesis protein FlhF [Ramlibacter tataouinensis]